MIRTKYLLERMLFLFYLMCTFSVILILILFIAGISNPWFQIGSLLLTVQLGIFIYIFRKWIYLPSKQTAKTLNLFSKGYVLNAISEIKHPYTPEMAAATLKFKEMLNTKELINVSKKQAEYLALQNQINPHFLYNTLEGIRGEALTAGVSSIAEMTEALATFFRYTISNVENLVTLEDELTNIENYYIIQQYRFGDRLNLDIEINNDEFQNVMAYRLPKLTLQPIIENSIHHGLEQKIGNGNMKVTVETTPSRLIIVVSDDGLGIEENHLKALNQKLTITSLDYVKPDTERKGGIAIINVNNRIKLLFGEEYGIYIYSTQTVGTDVVITLPLILDNLKVT